MDAHFRTRFGEELVAFVRHTQQTLPGVFQLSLAATPMFGGLHSTWAGRRTVIAPCFFLYTSFSKVFVYVFETTSRGPHTLLERLSIWSSLLWHSEQEVSLCIKVTSAASWALSAALHLVLTISCATFLFTWVTFKNLTEILLIAGIFQLFWTGARFAWCQSQT